jgi:hypothetical protein
MKHKFHGERCIYCGEAADTSDHAIGKSFFLIERRDNLPQVPACRSCNNRKATLESYLMTVLPFGAKNADAAKILKEMVPPRLEKNAKLFKKLQKGLAKSGGKSMPFDHKQLEELFAMIAKALAWVHFEHLVLKDGYDSIASVFNNSAEQVFLNMIGRGEKIVSGDLGNGTFRYEGAQFIDKQVTVWRFSIYGGVDFGGDEHFNEAASLAVAVTNSPTIVQKLRYSSFARDKKSPKVGRNEMCPCGSGIKYKKCHASPLKN